MAQRGQVNAVAALALRQAERIAGGQPAGLLAQEVVGLVAVGVGRFGIAVVPKLAWSGADGLGIMRLSA
jgi:hypothetical protein